MPPVGNFAPPPSASKENKKRRGGAGSQMTGGATVTDATSVTVGHNNKNGNLRNNANKVSVVHFEPFEERTICNSYSEKYFLQHLLIYSDHDLLALIVLT